MMLFSVLPSEGIAATMGRDGDLAPVRMSIPLVRSGLADEIEAIAMKSGDQLPCREGAKDGEVCHEIRW
jgi:hypothetical protein